MKFVPSDELKPGMRLAKPIYNKNGVLLFDRNTQLTIPGINSITNFGLIGIYILEPAEPLPPLSQEDIEFEQAQTIYMFKLRSVLEQIEKRGRLDKELSSLIDDILRKYGALDHRVNFNQNLRSADDYALKHAISTAILCAMISHRMGMTKRIQQILVAAALLYDFGYRFVPRTILAKADEEMSASDRDTIQLSLEKGLSFLYMYNTEYDFMKKAVTLCEYYIYSSSETHSVKRPDPSIISLMNILKVADIFDQTTGMMINHAPESEIMAMRKLEQDKDNYDSKIVRALAQCIHVVPAGASVDLSTKEKAIVLEENPTDYIHPLILTLRSYQVINLADPAEAKKLQIVDLMKTMDNRIAIDEDTLKQFVADAKIKKTADRFRMGLRK